MRTPPFLQETYAFAKANRVWALAYLATLLMPLMLIFARAGIEVCAAIIGVCFLVHSMRSKNWRWVREPFFLVCLIAWGWLCLIVTPLAHNPGAGALEATMWLRMPLMFTALRRWVLAAPSARLSLVTLMAFTLGFVVLDSVVQFATGTSLSGHARHPTGRLSGPFSALKVGLYLGKFVVPVTALMLVASLGARYKPGILAACALLFAVICTIVLSGERSAFLCVLLACGTGLGLLALVERRWRLWAIGGGVLMLLALVLLFYTSDWVATRAAAMFFTMQHFTRSDYGLLVQAGIEMGREHWLHGVGLRNFRELCPDLDYYGNIFRGMHPHNAFLEWFAEAGLPGLLLFLAMVALLAREGWHHFRHGAGEVRLLGAFALGMLVQDFFPLMGMQSFFANWAAGLQWFALALLFSALPPREARC